MTEVESIIVGESSEKGCSSESKEDDLVQVELPPSTSAEHPGTLEKSSQEISGEFDGERTANGVVQMWKNVLLDPKNCPRGHS